MNRDDIIHNNEIKLAIYLKMNQLKRECLDTLTYDHLLVVLFQFIWKRKLPSSIHIAVNDIMKLSAEEIVTSLHTFAIMQGAQTSVDQIEGILKGELYD